MDRQQIVSEKCIFSKNRVNSGHTETKYKEESQCNRRTRGHNLRRHLRKVAVTFVCHPEITVRAIFFALCTVYCYVLYIIIII